uniref:HDC00217 n=1 Tax=Drosophila melanogaster TaxID=7227 RepID=Q6IHZ7_DROME|nr:TPA_inf: HDC00217 [Drosophila melanogaster]
MLLPLLCCFVYLWWSRATATQPDSFPILLMRGARAAKSCSWPLGQLDSLDCAAMPNGVYQWQLRSPKRSVFCCLSEACLLLLLLPLLLMLQLAILNAGCISVHACLPSPMIRRPSSTQYLVSRIHFDDILPPR